MPKVKVFSTPICPYCTALKNFLEERHIKFEDIDVSQNEKVQKEMIEKSGQMSVPVVAIDGEYIVGFDRQRIVKLLDIE